MFEIEKYFSPFPTLIGKAKRKLNPKRIKVTIEIEMSKVCETCVLTDYCSKVQSAAGKEIYLNMIFNKSIIPNTPFCPILIAKKYCENKIIGGHADDES